MESTKIFSDVPKIALHLVTCLKYQKDITKMPFLI